MPNSKKDPAASDGRADNLKRVNAISQNDTPRERWRARVPMRRIEVSDKLQRFLPGMREASQ
jgi:hypothetical protein